MLTSSLFICNECPKVTISTITSVVVLSGFRDTHSKYGYNATHSKRPKQGNQVAIHSYRLNKFSDAGVGLVEEMGFKKL